MPKKKTHSGAAKRFKKLKSGKVKYSKVGRRHHFTQKTAKRKRRLRKSAYLSGRDLVKISSLMN